MKKELTERQVMTKVSTIISYLKNETKNDLLAAKQQGMISLEINEIEKVCNVIELSIQKNFIRSSNELTSLFK